MFLQNYSIKIPFSKKLLNDIQESIDDYVQYIYKLDTQNMFMYHKVGLLIHKPKIRFRRNMFNVMCTMKTNMYINTIKVT